MCRLAKINTIFIDDKLSAYHKIEHISLVNVSHKILMAIFVLATKAQLHTHNKYPMINKFHFAVLFSICLIVIALTFAFFSLSSSLGLTVFHIVFQIFFFSRYFEQRFCKNPYKDRKKNRARHSRNQFSCWNLICHQHVRLKLIFGLCQFQKLDL